MTINVSVGLTIKQVQIDYVGQTLVVNFVFTKFGTPQTASLQVGVDFTTAQLSGNLTSMEALFNTWVNRQ